MYEGLDDAELLEMWRDGEEAAGRALFERHERRLYRFFANKVPEEHQADLIQEAFLAVVKSIDRFERRSSFRTYLLGVANNVLKDHIRKIARKSVREVELAGLDHFAAVDLGPSPSNEAADREEQRILLEALRHIPLIHQVALELCFWEKMTAPEIAEVLEIPLGTAKTRIRDGMEHLRGEFKRLASTDDWRRSTFDSLDRWARRMYETVTARDHDRSAQAPRRSDSGAAERAEHVQRRYDEE